MLYKLAHLLPRQRGAVYWEMMIADGKQVGAHS